MKEVGKALLFSSPPYGINDRVGALLILLVLQSSLKRRSKDSYYKNSRKLPSKLDMTMICGSSFTHETISANFQVSRGQFGWLSESYFLFSIDIITFYLMQRDTP